MQCLLDHRGVERVGLQEVWCVDEGQERMIACDFCELNDDRLVLYYWSPIQTGIFSFSAQALLFKGLQ